MEGIYTERDPLPKKRGESCFSRGKLGLILKKRPRWKKLESRCFCVCYWGGGGRGKREFKKGRGERGTGRKGDGRKALICILVKGIKDRRS